MEWVYVVTEPCGDEDCYCFTVTHLYATEQTAKQAADQLYGARYGGKMRIQTQTPFRRTRGNR